jgi:hypothetical protein
MKTKEKKTIEKTELSAFNSSQHKHTPSAETIFGGIVAEL